MKTRFLTTVAIMGLVIGHGRAWAQLQPFSPGDVLFADDLNDIVDQVNNNTAVFSGRPPLQTVTVNCDAGETLTAKLETARRGTTIQITGTCREAVVIPTRGLILDGQGSAIIEGGNKAGILVQRGKNIVINGLTVQNGEHGIFGIDGAIVDLSNVTVQNNAKTGIVIENNSTLRATGCIVSNNGEHGLVVEDNSSASIQPSPASATGCTVSSNGVDGIAVENNSSLFITTSTINGNDEHGIAVENSSAAIITAVSITGNGIDSAAKASGILVENSSSAEIMNVTISNNTIDGVSVERGSSAGITSSTITNNTEIGVSVENNSTVAILGSSTITGNVSGPNIEVLFSSFLTIDDVATNFGNSLICRQRSLARKNDPASTLLTAFSGCF